MNKVEARDGELHRFSPVDVVIPKRRNKKVSVVNTRVNGYQQLGASMKKIGILLNIGKLPNDNIETFLYVLAQGDPSFIHDLLS